jgi:hypothetical protein
MRRLKVYGAVVLSCLLLCSVKVFAIAIELRNDSSQVRTAFLRTDSYAIASVTFASPPPGTPFFEWHAPPS